MLQINPLSYLNTQIFSLSYLLSHKFIVTLHSKVCLFQNASFIFRFYIRVMITFLTENVEMPDIQKTPIRAWIKEVADSYGKRVGEIAYVFCDDAKILEVNQQYLQHDYYTDVITFDYSEKKKISGDIFISLDTVKTNAKKFSQPYLTELHRVIIHGVLHLCGINDKGPGEREVMENAEDKALSLFSIPE